MQRSGARHREEVEPLRWERRPQQIVWLCCVKADGVASKPIGSLAVFMSAPAFRVDISCATLAVPVTISGYKTSAGANQEITEVAHWQSPSTRSGQASGDHVKPRTDLESEGPSPD
jgi:hypothetical protein